jgi:hypothetical protein
MANIFDGFLKQLATGDQIKDFKHASRLYVDSNYRLSPKYSWLYHVFFDVNPSLTKIDVNRLTEAGMLVKSIDLPKFNIETKTLNNYNRPEIVQTKIKYESISINFHDDQANVVRLLWYDYFNHYYRDADTGYADSSGAINQTYHGNYKYRSGQREILNQFGYSPRNDSGINGPQYLQAIRIYSLHQKKFSEYTLINPFILSFGHGSHAGGSNEGLENSMTIGFTSILYASGNVTRNTVKGFADLHYDKSPSPLTPAGGGTNSILGPGGILSAADEIFGDAGGGKFGSAAFKLFRSYNKNKNVDLLGLAKSELLTAGLDMLNDRDPRDRFFTPYSGGLANKPPAGPPTISESAPPAPGSVSSNGSSIGLGSLAIVGGAALALTGKPELGAGLAIAGLITNSKGQITGAPIDKTVNVEKPEDPNASLSAVSSANPLNFFSFGGALLKVAKEREEKAKAEQEKKSKEQADAWRTYYTTGAGSTASAPTFETGSDTAVSSSGIFAQTPYARTVVAGSSSTAVAAFTRVAASESSSFIQNGNPQQMISGTALSYAGIGLSTNPAPPTGEV